MRKPPKYLSLKRPVSTTYEFPQPVFEAVAPASTRAPYLLPFDPKARSGFITIRFDWTEY